MPENEKENEEELLDDDEDEDEDEDENIDEDEDIEDDEEVIGDEESDEPNEELEDHPADVLADVIDEINKQQNRLINKKVHDLNYELKNNLYPIVKQGFSSILEYISHLEDDGEEQIDEESEKFKEIQEATEKEMRLMIQACKVISNIDKSEKKPDSDDWKLVAEWAKMKIEQSKDMQLE